MRAGVHLGAAALVALAACQAAPTTSPGAVPTPMGMLPAEDVLSGMPPMGAARLDLDAVLSEYQSVCLDTLPRFAGAEAVVREHGLVQNSATGTWYDPRRELSVSLVPQGGQPVCSLIFATAESPSTLGVALALHTSLLGGGSGDIGADPNSGAATTTTGGGDVMRFEPNVGGRPDLHRVVIVGAR